MKKRTVPQDESQADAIQRAVDRALAGPLAELRALHAAMAGTKTPKLGSVAEAARATGLCQATIRRQVERGDIAAKRVGRRVLIDMAALMSGEKRRR